MNEQNLFVDTNILIYLVDRLRPNHNLAEIIDHNIVHISIISEIEFLSFEDLSESDKHLFELIISDTIINDHISLLKNEIINLRRKYRLKFPDAAIAASAIYLGYPFLTADKTFHKVEELNMVLFEP